MRRLAGEVGDDADRDDDGHAGVQVHQVVDVVPDDVQANVVDGDLPGVGGGEVEAGVGLTHGVDQLVACSGGF